MALNRAPQLRESIATPQHGVTHARNGGQPLLREQGWKRSASLIVLLALLLAAIGLYRHVRPLGYSGEMKIPGRDVQVLFRGGTLVQIVGRGMSGRSCSLGHPTCPRSISSQGVTVSYSHGWFFVAY